MAKDIEEIAAALGAKVIARLPRAGGGAFGAARRAWIVADLQARLRPDQGLRPGRPIDPSRPPPAPARPPRRRGQP